MAHATMPRYHSGLFHTADEIRPGEDRCILSAAVPVTSADKTPLTALDSMLPIPERFDLSRPVSTWEETAAVGNTDHGTRPPSQDPMTNPLIMLKRMAERGTVTCMGERLGERSG